MNENLARHLAHVSDDRRNSQFRIRERFRHDGRERLHLYGKRSCEYRRVEQRLPHPFETSLPSVIAVSDVRADSVKRVASAVGEGSICVQIIHRALAEKI